MSNKELLTALLSMDAYNRGYNQGIQFSSTQIGTATLSLESVVLAESDEVAASFYAAAYSTAYGTVISYRGTDEPWIDAITGWPVNANPLAEQAILATQFYQAVVGQSDPFSSDITLTGHSLGGGLAGLVASAYGQDAEIYDSMAFELADAASATAYLESAEVQDYSKSSNLENNTLLNDLIDIRLNGSGATADPMRDISREIISLMPDASGVTSTWH